jgi:hypothetical protein
MNTTSITSREAFPRFSTGSDPAESADERYARRLTARLSAGAQELPHDIAERLRVARTQAVAQRRRPTRQTATVGTSGGAALLGLGQVWWTRLGAAIPLVALVAGLMVISIVQDDDRTSELADVDSALLADDLPPTAYADPGFAQFLKGDAAAH